MGAAAAGIDGGDDGADAFVDAVQAAPVDAGAAEQIAFQLFQGFVDGLFVKGFHRVFQGFPHVRQRPDSSHNPLSDGSTGGNRPEIPRWIPAHLPTQQ